MALPAGTVWEIRTAGSDTNGGGFVAGASGNDYSQQNASNSGAIDKSTTDAVANGTTTITSATANFNPAVIGNIIYLQGGTGSLAASWYQVTARTNSTTITIDRTVAAGTGITMNIGGALATITQAAALWVIGNKGFVKADGTYAPTASITLSSNSTPADNPPNYLIGYTSTRTDKGRATIQATTNTGITLFNVTGTGWWIENFVLDCNSLGTSKGCVLGLYSHLQNCTLKNFTTAGVQLGNGLVTILNCEITGGTSAATAAIDINSNSNLTVFHCYIHDNACPGSATPVASGGSVFAFNVIANNTGASSDGLRVRYGTQVINNAFYANGRDGVRSDLEYMMAIVIRNNIFVNNGGYGINQVATPANAPSPMWDYNAYYNNTSGKRNNLDSSTTSSTVNDGVSAYTYATDLTLTGVPFTNAGAGDFSLNNTASQGAPCRAAGGPGAFLGASTTGYLDLGAVQHADPPPASLTTFVVDVGQQIVRYDDYRMG